MKEEEILTTHENVTPVYILLLEYFKKNSIGKDDRVQTIKTLYSKKSLVAKHGQDYEILQKYFKRHGVKKENHSKVINLLVKQKKLFVNGYVA